MNYSEINFLPWETDQDYWQCPICGSLNAELEENLERAHKNNVSCWKSEGNLCGHCGSDAKISLEQTAKDSTNQDLLENGLVQPEDI